MKDRKQLYDKAERDQTLTDYQGQLFSNTVPKMFWKYVESLCKDRTGIAPLKFNSSYDNQ